MYYNGKTILGHKTNDSGYKTIVKKIKKFSYMSNSMILAAILKICKLDHQDVISQLANIGFRIQHTKLPLIQVSNPFLHKMPVLVNFSGFFS